MSYIGNPIISTDFPKDTFSGNGSTTAFTMSIAPASVNAVIVVVSGITQDPSTYTISGTTLTFSSAPPTGTSNISVRHLGVAGIPNTPSDASVTSAKLASGAALSNLGSSQLASANLPAGSVLQVVQQTYTAFTTTSSTSYSDTGLTLNITPKFATSKILIQVGMELALNGTSNSISTQIVKNGSSLITQERVLLSSANTSANIFFQYLDSPATTSTLTYKIQWASLSGNLVRLNDWQTADNKALSSITLTEIAA